MKLHNSDGSTRWTAHSLTVCTSSVHFSHQENRLRFDAGNWQIYCLALKSHSFAISWFDVIARGFLKYILIFYWPHITIISLWYLRWYCFRHTTIVLLTSSSYYVKVHHIMYLRLIAIYHSSTLCVIQLIDNWVYILSLVYSLLASIPFVYLICYSIDRQLRLKCCHWCMAYWQQKCLPF